MALISGAPRSTARCFSTCEVFGKTLSEGASLIRGFSLKLPTCPDAGRADPTDQGAGGAIEEEARKASDRSRATFP